MTTPVLSAARRRGPALTSTPWSDSTRHTGATERMNSNSDIAYAAHLVDDLLAGTGATQEDRQAIADHLTGRHHLDLHGPSRDPWVLTTALAQAWHTYSERAHLPAPLLLRILDGECSMVTNYLDTETAARILKDEEEEPTPDQVASLLHWLEREDLWRDDATAEQVRAAWSRYRAQHPV